MRISDWSSDVCSSDLLNGSAYLSDVSDLQRDITVASVTQGTVSVVANATDATILGFEAEMTVIPVRGLELTGNVGYVDIQYKNVQFDLNGDGSIDRINYVLVPPGKDPWNNNNGYRKSIVEGKDVEVRVVLGGGRSNKKKKK